MNTWMRPVGLGLGSVWAAWWTFFAVASSLGNVIGKGHPISLVPVMIVLGLPASVVIAWRWPMAGGALFVGIGLLLSWASLNFFHNPPATTWFLLLALAFPPFFAGVLLLANGWRWTK